MDARQILTIGVVYKPVRGGIAAVESVYSTFYKPFNHIATTSSDSNRKLVKSAYFIRAYFKFLYWMVFHREIKIVHVHSSSGNSFMRKRIFINMAKCFGKKVVFHCHGGKFPEFTKEHLKLVSETLSKCDCIIALSEWWEKWFKETFHITNVVVIKNVIAEPHINKVKHDRFTLSFLGLLGQNKGIYDLLEVLSEHKEEFDGKLRLLIGGNGETEKVANYIRGNQLENIVKFEGWVSGKKKELMLNSSDGFILPSYHEGLPISILEAESYGLPIISTNVGGIPEIVKNGVNGFLATPGDRAALYSAITQLMCYNSILEMRKASLSVAQEHLPKHVENQLKKLYDDML